MSSGAPNAKRLRDLLVDFYLEHDPEKLQRGLDINGIVMWTGRNGIDALNEVLKNQTGHVLDLKKNLGSAQKKAMRISTAFNPDKPKKQSNEQKERELFSRIHFFYMRNDPDKLSNIHQLHKYALYHGEGAFNERLRKKYGKELPTELPKIDRNQIPQMGNGGVTVKNIVSNNPQLHGLIAQATGASPAQSQPPVQEIQRSQNKRKKKGKKNKGGDANDNEPAATEGPKLGYLQPQHQSFNPATAHMSTMSSYMPPVTGPPPSAPPKIETPQRSLPPLPKKNVPPRLPAKPTAITKALPALPTQPSYQEPEEEEFDEQQATDELRQFFEYHDPEQIDVVEEYLDIWAYQGKDRINTTLGNIYGMSLDEYLEDPPANQHQPQFANDHVSFMGAGGPSVKMNGPMNGFQFQQPQFANDHVSFMGAGGPSVAMKGSPLKGLQFKPNAGNQAPSDSHVSFMGTGGTSVNMNKQNLYMTTRFAKQDEPDPEEEFLASFKNAAPPPPTPKPSRNIPPLPQSPSKRKIMEKVASQGGSEGEFLDYGSSSQPGSRKKRGFLGSTMQKMKSMRVKSLNATGLAKASKMGSFMKNVKNMATGSRFSVSPNANLEVRAPLEATPDEGACENYRLDMMGSSFGVCVCGFGRADHSFQAKFGARRNIAQQAPRNTNPTIEHTPKETAKYATFQFSAPANNQPTPPTSRNNQQAQPVTQQKKYNNLRKQKSSGNLFNSSHKTRNTDISTPYDKTRVTSYEASQPVLDSSRAMYNMAYNRNVEIVNAPSDAGGGPCAEFRIDINGRFHGDCICGYSKLAHKKATNVNQFESDARNKGYQATLQKVKNNLGGKSTQAVAKKNSYQPPTFGNVSKANSSRNVPAPASYGNAKQTSPSRNAHQPGSSRNVNKFGSSKNVVQSSAIAPSSGGAKALAAKFGGGSAPAPNLGFHKNTKVNGSNKNFKAGGSSKNIRSNQQGQNSRVKRMAAQMQQGNKKWGDA